MISTKETRLIMHHSDKRSILAELDEGETEADQTSATKQVTIEKKALGESRMVFEGLITLGNPDSGRKCPSRSGNHGHLWKQ